MQPETFDDIPMLDEVLELQRDLSASNDIGELIFTIADRFRKLYGVEAILGLDVQGLEPGQFRVMDFFNSGEGVTPDNIFENVKWDLPRDPIHSPAESDGVISQIVQSSKPSHCKEIDPKADPVLSHFVDWRCDIIAVPVFHDRQLDEWFLVFRQPGSPVDETLVRLLVSMFNMFSRSIIQIILRQQVAELNEKLDKKLQEVAQVQRSILPEAVPDHETLDIAVHYLPCDMAGGDYYDFRSFDDGSVGIVIADVSGHGPGAAVVMAMLRTAMSIDRALHSGAGGTVRTINRYLWDGLSAGMFVTAFFLKIHPETGRVGYASAGHWPALVRKANGAIHKFDQGSGPPIGMLEELEAPGGDYQLEDGDTVLLYTDGITEAFDPNDKAFGITKLEKTLASDHSASSEATLDTIRCAVETHAKGREPMDDQCMVAIRYYESEGS